MHVGQQWCDRRVRCDCWAPWRVGRVHQRVAGSLLAQGTEGRQLLGQGELEETSHRTSVRRRDLLLTMGQMDLEGLVSPVIPRRVRMDYELLSDPVGVQAVSQGNPPPGGRRICSAGQSRAWEGLRHLLCLQRGGRQALNHSWPSADGCRSPRRSGRAWHSTSLSSLELPPLLLWTRVWPGEPLELRRERLGWLSLSTEVVSGRGNQMRPCRLCRRGSRDPLTLAHLSS